MNPQQTVNVELRVCCCRRALHFRGTSRSPVLRFLWITRREVTAAAPAAKKCCWTTSSPQRTSLQHIWSLSIAHQVSSLVAHRRIKTTRSSLLFNYSITQKETVITWNITKSRRVRSVLRWRRAGANWQHLQTLFRRLRKGGRSERETHHSATLQPEQTAASRTQIFQHLALMRSLVISLSRCFIFIWVHTLCFFGRCFLLFISSTTACTNVLFQPAHVFRVLALTPEMENVLCSFP